MIKKTLLITILGSCLLSTSVAALDPVPFPFEIDLEGVEIYPYPHGFIQTVHPVEDSPSEFRTWFENGSTDIVEESFLIDMEETVENERVTQGGIPGVYRTYEFNKYTSGTVPGLVDVEQTSMGTKVDRVQISGGFSGYITNNFSLEFYNGRRDYTRPVRTVDGFISWVVFQEHWRDVILGDPDPRFPNYSVEYFVPGEDNITTHTIDFGFLNSENFQSSKVTAGSSRVSGTKALGFSLHDNLDDTASGFLWRVTPDEINPEEISASFSPSMFPVSFCENSDGETVLFYADEDTTPSLYSLSSDSGITTHSLTMFENPSFSWFDENGGLHLYSIPSFESDECPLHIYRSPLGVWTESDLCSLTDGQSIKKSVLDMSETQNLRVGIQTENSSTQTSNLYLLRFNAGVWTPELFDNSIAGETFDSFRIGGIQDDNFIAVYKTAPFAATKGSFVSEWFIAAEDTSIYPAANVSNWSIYENQ